MASGDKGTRLAGIEGLRAVAAASILVYHVWLYGAPDGAPVDLGPLTKAFDGLQAGVTLFFVLSGFLLYRVFVPSLLGDGRLPSIRRYLRNRALRIVPAYWVVLLGVAVVFEHRLLTEPAQLVANMLFVQNYVPSYAVSGEAFAGIAPAWSLVIEVSFYVALPLLALLAARGARAGRGGAVVVLAPVAVMFVAGLAAKVAARGWQEGEALSVFQHSLPTHADWFAAGMAVAVSHVLWQEGRLRLPRGWRPAALVSAVVLVVAATKLFYGGTLDGLEQQTPIALACALVLAAIVFAQPGNVAVRALEVRPVVLVGLASYSLFLVHDPLVRGLREWGVTLDGRAGFVVNLALIGTLSVALAAVLYVYVERPALARKRRPQVGDTAEVGSAKPPVRRAPPRQELIPLRAAIHAAIGSVAGADEGLVVDVAAAGDRLVDRDQVAAVLTPLLENACLYGAAPIEVVAEQVSGAVRVAVVDAGRGIDDSFRSRLFEPNARSPESARVVPGSGLGLSRARASARASGGDVTYEPRAVTDARFVATFTSANDLRRAAGGGRRGSGGRRPAPRLLLRLGLGGAVLGLFGYGG